MGATYYTVNMCDPTRRRIYFICDVPHLLKTTRNNLENSHGNLNSRGLVINAKAVKWPHIVSTVEMDKAQALTKLPSVREEHIHLSPQLRMRVRLAAQVLSTSMANAILARETPEMAETANFCKMFDRWFDCLNGRYIQQDIHLRKPELAPYCSANDWRLKWMEDGFLGWLNGWELEVQAVPNLTKGEKSRLLLSYQTMEGLRITTKSFIALVPELLDADGAKFILPEKLNQDKLEMFFGKLRRAVGDSDNPSVHEVGHRILTLLITGTQTIAPRNGNCTLFENVPAGEASGYQLKRQKRKR